MSALQTQQLLREIEIMELESRVDPYGALDTLRELNATITDKKLKEIDNKGSFESDDKIGFFFKAIKHIQDILNDFKVIRIKE